MIFLVTMMISLLVSSADAKTCSYSFDSEQSVVEGTGYKFTEKKGVTAKFLDFSLNKNQGESFEKLMDGLEVTVDLMSVDSGDELRDRNLREAFFSLLKGDSKAIVRAKKISGDKLEATLQVNDVEKPIQLKFANKDKTVTAEGHFDMIDHLGQSALESLARQCKALHTGADGVAKTWTDFAIKVTAKLVEKCQDK